MGLGAGSAAAQPAPGPVPLPPPPPAEPPAVVPPAEVPLAATPPEPRNDAGWQLYHDAFGALLEGKPARARRLGVRLLREFPDHPASLAIGRSRGPLQLDAALVASNAGAPREVPSKAAKAELGLFQGLHGIVLGVELALLLDPAEPAVYFGLALAGGAAGGAISVNAVPELTSGKRALLNSGTAWGAANAALLLAAVDPEGDSAATFVLPMMAGQLGGLAIGASLFGVEPTAGQVGLANSGGQWAGAIVAMLLAASESDTSSPGWAISILGSMDAGLAIGGYLAAEYPHVSRAQTLLLDAGGIFGAVAGGGLAVLARDDFDRVAALGGAIGAAAGLGVAAYLTRNWGTDPDDEDGGATTYLVPSAEGRGAVAGMGWRW